MQNLYLYVKSENSGFLFINYNAYQVFCCRNATSVSFFALLLLVIFCNHVAGLWKTIIFSCLSAKCTQIRGEGYERLLYGFQNQREDFLGPLLSCMMGVILLSRELCLVS